LFFLRQLAALAGHKLAEIIQFIIIDEQLVITIAFIKRDVSAVRLMNGEALYVRGSKVMRKMRYQLAGRYICCHS